MLSGRLYKGTRDPHPKFAMHCRAGALGKADPGNHEGGKVKCHGLDKSGDFGDILKTGARRRLEEKKKGDHFMSADLWKGGERKIYSREGVVNQTGRGLYAMNGSKRIRGGGGEKTHQFFRISRGEAMRHWDLVGKQTASKESHQGWTNRHTGRSEWSGQFRSRARRPAGASQRVGKSGGRRE